MSLNEQDPTGRKTDIPSQRANERAVYKLVREIYATFLELRIWRKIDEAKPGVFQTTIDSLQAKLQQQIIDYLIGRKDGDISVGRIELWTYSRPLFGFKEEFVESTVKCTSGVFVVLAAFSHMG